MDPESKTGGLFTEYVNTFRKIKVEASGYPNWCNSEQDKAKYISDYERKVGVQLEASYIKKSWSASLSKAIFKFILGAIWDAG
jgi:hypothetical protein